MRFSRLLTGRLPPLRLVATAAAAWLAVGAGLVPAAAQQAQVRRLTNEDGLPAANVLAIDQDRRGFLWFGTSAGVARYDGVDFEVQTTADGLRGNNVVAVAEDGQGRIAFATREAGVTLWDGSEHLVLGAAELGGERIADLYRDPDGGLWVCGNGGLARVSEDGIRRFGVADGLPGGDVRVALRGSDGEMWVGTARGLARGRGDGFTAVHDGLPDATPIEALAEDITGRLWVGSVAGLFVRTDGRFRRVRLAPGAGAEHILGVTSSDDDGVWVGTTRGAFRVTSGGEASEVRLPGSSGGRVNEILVDTEANVWFATERGASMMVPGPFRTYTRDDGLPDDFVRGVDEDPSGDIWVATRSGVAVLSADGEVRGTGRSGMAEEGSRGALFLPDGSVLLATTSGLRHWLDGRGSSFHRRDGLPDDTVTSLTLAQDGTAWVGTTRGLARFVAGAVEVTPASAELDGVDVTDLEIDADGALWVATRGRGLLRDAGGHFVGLLSGSPLAGATVWDLAAAPDGGVWAGTNGHGALRFGRDGSVNRWDTSNGLTNDFVQQVVIDEQGRVWFFTNRGIDRWDPTSGFTHFGLDDGLAGLAATPGAALHDSSGRLWFGTPSGLVRFDADAAAPDAVAPRVYIEDVVAGGEPFDFLDPQPLPPSRNNLTFRYTAPSFADAGATRFRYRLEGLQSRWSPLTAERSVSYAGLGPGVYTFLVEAINGRGTWSTEAASVTVEVLPAPHQTRSFQALAVAALIGLVSLYFMRRMRTVERERTRLASVVDKRIRELVEKNALLERMATTDELTGLPNRRFFLESLERELRKLTRVPTEEDLSLLILDLDRFKSINDRYGHVAGDEVLRHVSRTLATGVRATDLAARYGGEEFAILLPGTGRDGALFLAEKLRAELEASEARVNGSHVRVTISIGVSTTSTPERFSPDIQEDLLRRADEAMYRAKEGGRNRVVQQADE